MFVVHPSNDVSSAKNFEVSSPPSRLHHPLEHKELCRLRRNDRPGMSVRLINIQTNAGKWKEKSTYYSMNVSCNSVGEMMPYLCLRALSHLIMRKMLSGSAMQSGIVFARLCWKVEGNYLVISVIHIGKANAILHNEFSLNLDV
ncbi:hypothetical protein CDAR_48731 [Caerostris darwini]|uniref:Uncharacterized protein n=1 Tax=Caerostris darwini TaxID=1538125 RepID=A0AAV4NKA9_9ARAC|nr:hypothetical protein CDAR_48731 [Caerostris darwini]